MKLLNVRLSPEDARLVAALRAAGVSISEVVRAALRREGNRVIEAVHDPIEILDGIMRRFPAPQQSAATENGTERIDATDRRAVQRHIRARLRGQRRTRKQRA
jgi:hypothetical protein